MKTIDNVWPLAILKSLNTEISVQYTKTNFDHLVITNSRNIHSFRHFLKLKWSYNQEKPSIFTF